MEGKSWSRKTLLFWITFWWPDNLRIGKESGNTELTKYMKTVHTAYKYTACSQYGIFLCFQNVEITLLKLDRVTDPPLNHAPRFSSVTRGNAHCVFLVFLLQVYIQKPQVLSHKGRKKNTRQGSINPLFLFCLFVLLHSGELFNQ